MLQQELSAKGKRRAQFWGAGFIVVGIPGLVLPLVQGVLFILIGLILLSFASKRLQGWIHRVRDRYPRFAYAYTKAEIHVRRLFKLENSS